MSHPLVDRGTKYPKANPKAKEAVDAIVAALRSLPVGHYVEIDEGHLLLWKRDTPGSATLQRPPVKLPASKVDL